VLGPPGKAVEQIQKHKHEERVSLGDARVSFTTKDMIRNERRVISSDELLNEVWRYENYSCMCTVDEYIARLRQQLEREPSRPPDFRTAHGAGYKFLPQHAPRSRREVTLADFIVRLGDANARTQPYGEF
jgi:DNA-binding response OmpR family regulator